jgi:hypothetical protein
MVSFDNGDGTVDYYCTCSHTDGWGDTCETAYEIIEIPFADTGSTCGYNDDYEVACPYAGGSAADVVYSFTPEHNIDVDISLCDSAYDTKVFVFAGSCDGTSVACNDDYCGENGWRSYIESFGLEAGITYYIVIDGFGTYCGDYVFSIVESQARIYCSGTSLYGQTPVIEPVFEEAEMSCIYDNASYIAYDNFDVNESVSGLEWWGFEVLYDAQSNSWVDCDGVDSVFEIGFYEDFNGLCGPLVKSLSCMAESGGTGIYAGDYELRHYWTRYMVGCVNDAEWVTVQKTNDGCIFLWAESDDGDGLSLRSVDGAISQVNGDRSFCLKPEESYTFQPDLGDAADSSNGFGLSMEAYPGVEAKFASVFCDSNFGSEGPSGPKHKFSTLGAYLGTSVSIENQADMDYDEDGVNNISPDGQVSDKDLCDDGLVLPLNLPKCRYTTVSYDLTVISGPMDLYFNVWIDYNRDGDWDDSFVCGDEIVSEWAVADNLLADMSAGHYRLLSRPFMSWQPEEGGGSELWVRLTVSDEAFAGGSWRGLSGNGGSGSESGYIFGETEDYLILAEIHPDMSSDLNCDNVVNLLDLARMSEDWLSSGCPD